MGSRIGGSNSTRQPSLIRGLINSNYEKDSKDLNSVNGEYNASAKKEHDRILNGIIKSSSKKVSRDLELILGTNEVLNNRKFDEIKYSKMVNLSIGNIIQRMTNFRLLMNKGYSRNQVHKILKREARDIRDQAIRTLIKRGVPFSISTYIGDVQKANKYINTFKKSGYSVRVHFASNPRSHKNEQLMNVYKSVTGRKGKIDTSNIMTNGRLPSSNTPKVIKPTTNKKVKKKLTEKQAQEELMSIIFGDN